MNSNIDTIFQKRVKELLKKSNRYSTHAQLAKKVNLSKSSIDGYMRKGSNLPPSDVIVAIANAFNVDVGYLYGNQSIPRIDSAKISSITGLSEKASTNLIDEICSNEALLNTLDALLSNDTFSSLLLAIYRYSHSHNQEIHIKDDFLGDEIIRNPSEVSAYARNGAEKLFNKLIEELYNSKSNQMKFLKMHEMWKELITNVYRLKEVTTYGDEAKQTMQDYITKSIEEISKIDPHSAYSCITAETIINNIDRLYSDLSK